MNNLKRNTTALIIIAILVLMGANVFFFSKTIALSDKIVSLEAKSVFLTRENVSFEKRLYEARSLDNLEKVADSLGFTTPVQTLYFEPPAVAKVELRP